MKKVTFILGLAIIASLAFSSAGYTYTFTDAVGDQIGGPIFDIYGMDIIDNSPNSIGFSITTNYRESGKTVGTWHTTPADLAIDVGNDGTYDLGVAFTAHDGLAQGSLYVVDDWYISDDFAPSSGYTWGYGEEVTIKSVNSAYAPVALDWTGWSAWSSTRPRYTIDFTLNLDDYWCNYMSGLDLKFHYASATCANDILEGTYRLSPEPATMVMFLLGLAGFFKLDKTRKKV